MGGFLLLFLSPPPIFAAPDQQVRKMTLKDSMGQATENSTELRGFRKQMRGAELAVLNETPLLFPKITAVAEYRLDNGENYSYEYGRILPYLVASYDILDSSSDKYDKRWTAMRNLFQSEDLLLVAEQNLYLNVASKYFGILLAEKRMFSAQRIMQQSEMDLKTAEIKYADGQLARIKLLTKQAAYAKASLNHNRAKHSFEIAEIELSGLLGLDESKFAVVDVEGEEESYEASLIEVKEFAGKHNVRVRIMDQALRQLPSYRGLVQRMRWPSVKMETFVGEDFSDNLSGDAEGDNNFGFRLFVSKPLYDGGVGKRKRKKMLLGIAQLQESMENKRKEFFRNLGLYHRKFIHSREEVQKSREQLVVAEDLSRIFRRSYELGVASLSDVDKNREMLENYELEYLAARNSYRLNELSLKLFAGVRDMELLAKSGYSWLAPVEEDSQPTSEDEDKN